MKIPTLLFAILLLNFASIFIFTNAQGEKGNIPTAENIYRPPPLNEGRKISGPAATLYNELDSDKIMYKLNPADFNEILASLDDDNWKYENIPEVIGQQSFQPNLQNPLPVASENVPNRGSKTNIGQESQLNKGKDKGKRKLDEYSEQNASNSNESNHLISNPYADWLPEGMLLPIGKDHSSKRIAITNDDENVPQSSSTQQNSSNNISMNFQQIEQNQMQNIQQIIAESSSKPTAADDHNPKDFAKKYHKNEFKCNWCNKIFPFKSELKRHVLGHQSERPFVCRNCERGFKRKDVLMDHMTKNKKPCIKKGTTQFVCPICERTFEKKRSLEDHLRRTCKRKANLLKSVTKGR